jgi:hypothetical protein
VIKTLLGELFPLFPDHTFHLGADETGRDVGGDKCSKQGQQEHSNAAQIERKLLKLVIGAGKLAAGWEEMITETKAATTATPAIINTWYALKAAQATYLGFETVECSARVLVLADAICALEDYWGFTILLEECCWDSRYR